MLEPPSALPKHVSTAHTAQHCLHQHVTQSCACGKTVNTLQPRKLDSVDKVQNAVAVPHRMCKQGGQTSTHNPVILPPVAADAVLGSIYGCGTEQVYSQRAAQAGDGFPHPPHPRYQEGCNTVWQHQPAAWRSACCALTCVDVQSRLCSTDCPCDEQAQHAGHHILQHHCVQ